MAGKLTLSTLNNDTGVLATQNGMTGIAKAWVNYNGVSQTINGSFNVTSVTRNSTGNYTIDIFNEKNEKTATARLSLFFREKNK